MHLPLLDSERSRRGDPWIQRRLDSANNMGQDLRNKADEKEEKLTKAREKELLLQK